MSDPVWPVSLPYALREGYGVDNELPLIRTEMESGPARVTRTSDSYVSNVSCSMVLNKEQMKTYLEFFESQSGANAGANWISMPIDTGQGVAFHRVRIMRYSSAPFSPTCKTITLAIETDEQVGEYG